MADGVQHDVETSWLFDLARRKAEESADASAILATAHSSSADYTLSDRRRSALNTILLALVREIAASIHDQLVLAAEQPGAFSPDIPPDIPDEFFQHRDDALMDMLVRNGL